MHLYWRIKEELRYLGEDLVFLDPRFVREYRRWFQKRFRRLESSQRHDTTVTMSPPCGWVTLTGRN